MHMSEPPDSNQKKRGEEGLRSVDHLCMSSQATSTRAKDIMPKVCMYVHRTSIAITNTIWPQKSSVELPILILPTQTTDIGSQVVICPRNVSKVLFQMIQNYG